MKSSTLLITFIISIAFLISGCELVGKGDLKQGTFEALVVGHLEKAFKGEAVFETLSGSSHDSGSLFILKLNDENSKRGSFRTVGFGREFRPEVGTYTLWNFEETDQLEPDQFFGAYDDPKIQGGFTSKGGTLEITFVNEKIIKGSFDFPAFEIIYEHGKEPRKVEVRVIGDFHAKEGSVGIILN